MSKRQRLSYGEIYKENSKFYRSVLPITDENLNRDNLYFFDTDLGDYDYLYGGYSLDLKLSRLQYTELRILGKYDKRPDLFCVEYYRDLDYWWIILLFNGMEYRTQFKAGVLIKVPVEEDIKNFLVQWRFDKQVREGA